MTEVLPAHVRRHRFPAEIIAHAVWLCYRFPLGFRAVDDLLAGRGIAVSFQTVSQWAAKFGLKFAHQLLRRSRGQFAGKWQLDEMVVTIKGKKYWLWRCRCQRLCARCPAEKPEKQAGISAADAQTARGSGYRPTGYGHRQAAFLLRGEGRIDAGRRASVTQGAQQSRRTFTSSCAATHDALQVGAAMPMFRLYRCQIAKLFLIHRKHLTAADHRELRSHAIAIWRQITMSING